MLVGKLCKWDVVTIRKCHSVVEAARRMRDHHVGDLVVVEGENDAPVGVLTDRDLVVGILAQDVDHLATLEVGDVLTEDVIVVSDHDDVSDVLHSMRKKGIRRVPVVNRAGALVGIFTLDDILGLVASDMASVAALVKRQRRIEQDRRPSTRRTTRGDRDHA
jgi:CBS domain-containing protein